MTELLETGHPNPFPTAPIYVDMKTGKVRQTLNFGRTSDGIPITRTLTAKTHEALRERVIAFESGYLRELGAVMTSREPGQWMDDANCRGRDIETFFKHSEKDLTAVARAFCKDCQVRLACLRYGLAGPNDAHRYGVWVGNRAYSASFSPDEARAAADVAVTALNPEYGSASHEITPHLHLINEASQL